MPESSRPLERYVDGDRRAKAPPVIRKRCTVRRKKYEEFEEDNGTVLRYARHENGGGSVEANAHVDPTAYVAASAYVDRGASVGAGARIGTGAWVDHDSVVCAGAIVGSAVHVGAGAVIGRDAKLGSRVKVGDNAHLWDNVRIEADEVISHGAVVRQVSRDQRAA